MSMSDKVVFLLGAGASVSQGLPTMADFHSFARRRMFDDYRNRPANKQQYDAIDRLLDFHRECRASSGMFNRDWDNIEEIYTQADLRRIACIPDAETAQGLCDAIAWAIWDIYRTDSNNCLAIGSALQKIVDVDLKPAIITTNYDIAGERAVSTWDRQPGQLTFYYPGFDRPQGPCNGQVLPFQGKSSTIPTSKWSVPVVKLHGSVNWINAGEECHALYDRGLKPDAQQDTNLKLNDKFLSRSVITDEIRKIITIPNETSVTPAIVPPMLGKSSDNPAVTFQWKSAIELLRTAREVWIIGYSFPETDSFMPRLLCEGLHPNGDLDFVKLVNIEREENYLHKLENLFGPIFYKNKVEYVYATAGKYFAFLSEGSARWEGAWKTCLKRAKQQRRHML